MPPPQIKYLSQQKIYHLLRTQGSSWLQRQVLYADKSMVVLNKTPKLVCQLNYTDWTNPYNTTEMTLNTIFHDMKKWIPTADPYTVHRLDKCTTGCLIVALNRAKAAFYSTQFRDKVIGKSYLAIVRGGRKTFSETSGTLSLPLTYDDGHCSVNLMTGKEAITEWELLSSSPKAPVSLMKLNLITGLKHQLRVHLARGMGAPILGDTLNSQKPPDSAITALTHLPRDRVFLHASLIKFPTFSRGGKIFFIEICAPVPVDFQRICHDLDIQIPQKYRETSIWTSVDKEMGDDKRMLWRDAHIRQNATDD